MQNEKMLETALKIKTLSDEVDRLLSNVKGFVGGKMPREDEGLEDDFFGETNLGPVANIDENQEADRIGYRQGSISKKEMTVDGKFSTEVDDSDEAMDDSKFNRDSDVTPRKGPKRQPPVNNDRRRSLPRKSSHRNHLIQNRFVDNERSATNADSEEPGRTLSGKSGRRHSTGGAGGRKLWKMENRGHARFEEPFSREGESKFGTGRSSRVAAPTMLTTSSPLDDRTSIDESPLVQKVRKMVFNHEHENNRPSRNVSMEFEESGKVADRLEKTRNELEALKEREKESLKELKKNYEMAESLEKARNFKMKEVADADHMRSRGNMDKNQAFVKDATTAELNKLEAELVITNDRLRNDENLARSEREEKATMNRNSKSAELLQLERSLASKRPRSTATENTANALSANVRNAPPKKLAAETKWDRMNRFSNRYPAFKPEGMTRNGEANVGKRANSENKATTTTTTISPDLKDAQMKNTCGPACVIVVLIIVIVIFIAAVTMINCMLNSPAPRQNFNKNEDATLNYRPDDRRSLLASRDGSRLSSETYSGNFNRLDDGNWTLRDPSLHESPQPSLERQLIPAKKSSLQTPPESDAGDPNQQVDENPSSHSNFRRTLQRRLLRRRTERLRQRERQMLRRESTSFIDDPYYPVLDGLLESASFLRGSRRSSQRRRRRRDRRTPSEMKTGGEAQEEDDVSQPRHAASPPSEGVAKYRGYESAPCHVSRNKVDEEEGLDEEDGDGKPGRGEQSAPTPLFGRVPNTLFPPNSPVGRRFTQRNKNRSPGRPFVMTTTDSSESDDYFTVRPEDQSRAPSRRRLGDSRYLDPGDVPRPHSHPSANRNENAVDPARRLKEARIAMEEREKIVPIAERKVKCPVNDVTGPGNRLSSIGGNLLRKFTEFVAKKRVKGDKKESWSMTSLSEDDDDDDDDTLIDLNQ